MGIGVARGSVHATMYTMKTQSLVRWAATFATVLACTVPALASAAQVNIAITDSAYSPKVTSVNQGDTVMWTNTGTMQHTVTFDTFGLSSMTLLPGQSFSYTFSSTGSFPYHCTLHGAVNGVGMSGTIVVNTPVVTTSASANTSGSQLQTQAQLLLAQVQALQAQLAGQSGQSVQTGSGVVTSTNGAVYNSATGSTVPVAGNAGVNSSACPNIGRVLKSGSTGDDVSRLQQFLARDRTIYPEAIVSGYFGALTEAAVQRWQTKYNVVSSGSPATTGYGVVGPRTAAAISLLCSTMSGGGSTNTNTTPSVGGYIQVSPISGNVPLQVSVLANVNTANSCAGAVYTILWGDATSAIQIPVSANNCSQVSQTYQHTYTNGGSYVITLTSGGHQTSATVIVNGGTVTSPQPSPTTLPAETFTASATSGAAPLAVTFSGIVNSNNAGWCTGGCSATLVFGDGTTGTVPLPVAANSSQSYSIAHTYQSAGTFSAKLYQGSAADNKPLVGSAITVTVGGGVTTMVLQSPTVTPNVGGNPLAVSIGFDLPPCPSYTMNWGDGTPSVSTSASCTSGGTASSLSLSHTFAASGTFTVTLTRGTRVDTVGLSISQ